MIYYAPPSEWSLELFKQITLIGYDTKSILKQSKTGFNSKFSFS